MTVDVHTTESWHLLRASDLYAQGHLSTQALERAVEHVLRGGYISSDLKLRSPLMDRVRQRRRQLVCRHIGSVIDISGYERERHICADCGLEMT